MRFLGSDSGPSAGGGGGVGASKRGLQLDLYCATHKVKPVWTSRMPRKTKAGVSTANQSNLLLYSYSRAFWTLTKALTNRPNSL